MSCILFTMKQKYIFFCVLFVMLVPPAAKGGNVVWHEGGAVTYTMQSKVSTVVTKAASLFEDDMKALTGNECYENNQGEVAVYQLDMASNKELKALEMQQVPLLKFIARKDAFWIGKRGNQVVIVGSNGRGAAYGLLELSRMSGITTSTSLN